MDMVRARLDFPALLGATRSMVSKWKADRVVIEDTHTGAALYRYIKHEVNAVAYQPDGSKIERLSVGLERLYAGTVVFPKNEPFFEEVRSELRSFPNGRHDDIVDSLSLFLSWGKHRIIRQLIQTKFQGGRRRRR